MAISFFKTQRIVDESGKVQNSSVYALTVKGPPGGGCGYRYFFIFTLDADALKVWGSNRIRDPGSLIPSNHGFSILAPFSVWVIANALNTPPVTIRWQHEIQRNCTAIYTNRVRMWFNRYTALESYPA